MSPGSARGRHLAKRRQTCAKTTLARPQLGHLTHDPNDSLVPSWPQDVHMKLSRLSLIRQVGLRLQRPEDGKSTLNGAARMLLIVCRLSSILRYGQVMPLPGKTSENARFGRNVRALRQGMGWSQEGFAEVVGVHRTYIGGIERGERNPTLTTIVRIARALEVPLPDLLYGVLEDKPLRLTPPASKTRLRAAEAHATYGGRPKKRKSARPS
jgi:transcriptional regulator with XRE-family HTH domain